MVFWLFSNDDRLISRKKNIYFLSSLILYVNLVFFFYINRKMLKPSEWASIGTQKSKEPQQSYNNKRKATNNNIKALAAKIDTNPKQKVYLPSQTHEQTLSCVSCPHPAPNLIQAIHH